MTPTISEAAVRAAVAVAARFTVNSTEPVVLADGANIVVHLRPAPVVAKVAAGAGNLMATDRGWLWHDFEDTCSGPLAWDLAASTASQYQDGPRVLAACGYPVDPRELAVCEQLRRLHLTVWYNLYAERLPELAPRAAELLASWPPAERPAS